MTHVFIVDDKSFPTHLAYSFAGTGAKEYGCDFLANSTMQFQSTVERLLTGMTSDISRIRVGDDILFYLQQSQNHEGLFFGCFKAASEPFLVQDNYLGDELGKNLTFRIILEPSCVYPKGATERECLDSLDGIEKPSEMCWSLIYRKLKGNRGCTMITDSEYSHIVQKIKNNNSGSLSAESLSYDSTACEIIKTDENVTYSGDKASLDISKRLRFKHDTRKAYESHLQAYILQNLESISALKVKESPIDWIGNEVSCGVGMQSIDIMFTQEDDDSINYVVCELKDEQPQPYIEAQLKKYIEWIKDYLAPQYHDKKVIINPTIVAPSPNDSTIELFNFIKSSTLYESDKVVVAPVRYIGFDFVDDAINFKEIIDE